RMATALTPKTLLPHEFSSETNKGRGLPAGIAHPRNLQSSNTAYQQPQSDYEWRAFARSPGKTELASCQDRIATTNSATPGLLSSSFSQDGCSNQLQHLPSCRTLTKLRHGIYAGRRPRGVGKATRGKRTAGSLTNTARHRECLASEGGLPPQTRAITYRSSRKSKLAGSIVQTLRNVKRRREKSSPARPRDVAPTGCPSTGRFVHVGPDGARPSWPMKPFESPKPKELVQPLHTDIR
ncbi:MAG: hypothetical protein RLY70_1789, partial [Planctomycetota bacterium]